jgi:D-glycero-alpha-D-manno-heptose-7-phosphate kinase
MGGKVSGAGGGGFLMFIVPAQKHVNVIKALNFEVGAQATGVHFTTGGAHSWRV